MHKGKVLFNAKRLNYAWPGSTPLWNSPLNFLIRSGDRIQITGANGAGKSTLIRLLNNEVIPTTGTLNNHSDHRFVLDQQYSLINRKVTVLEQVTESNFIKKPVREVKNLLHRHLLGQPMWDQPCGSLSGGEMMRLSLCCLALQSASPDTIILDEPNNLDLRNITILTGVLAAWKGTLIVVSHDKKIVRDLEVGKEILISSKEVSHNHT